MREERPELIVCSISGYGSEGPWRDQKAYDLLIQAESGLCAINGTAEGPARVGVSVCDIAAGMTAFQAILQALIARGRTGEGRLIEVSLFGAMADWMNVPYIQHRYGGATPTRQGLKHPTVAPYGAFDCADGKAILISIQNEREWQIFCTQVLGDPDLPTREGFRTNIERVANRSTVDRLCNDFFKQRDREANIALLAKAKIAYGRLSDLDDSDGPPAKPLHPGPNRTRRTRAAGPRRGDPRPGGNATAPSPPRMSTGKPSATSSAPTRDGGPCEGRR